jgi:signal transduction histidine kinase
MRRASRYALLARRLWAVALPLVVGLFLLAALSGEHKLSSEQSDDRGVRLGLGTALIVGQVAALYWRQTRPVTVAVVAVAGGAGSQLLAPSGLFPAAGMVALWSLTTQRTWRLSAPALVALLGVVAISLPTAADGDVYFVMAVVALVWALAEAVRNHRRALAEQTRRAVSEERARIARELHDVLAHSVSMIVVQASAGDDVFDHSPESARAALRAIETAGREALGELRLLLAAVRPGLGPDSGPDSGPGTVPAPDGETLRPGPGLDRIDEVTDPLREAGLDVAVRRAGTVRPLPGAVDLSAYRIVQEALTNCLRHARATRVVVELRYGRDLLEVDVRDNGQGDAGSAGASAGAGMGLIGMRERAAVLGGSVIAGPGPDGGYRVEARLPLAASP